MTHGLLSKTSAAPGGNGAEAGITRAGLLESAGAGRGHVRTFRGNVQSTDARSTWAGKGDGVRRPGIDETPLSASEAEILRRFL